MYLNVREVESALRSLAREYSLLSERVRLPYRTHGGRTCHALRIARPGRTAPALLVTGCVHAREWGGADISVSWAADLLEAATRGTGLRYGETTFKKDELQGVLDNLDLLVFPQVNPDGRFWSQTQDKLWRGNRHPLVHTAGCYGVDLNRNHDFLWDFPRCFHPDAGVGTSADPFHGSQTWRGPAPESEPEVRNIQYLYQLHPHIQYYVDLHSYGPVILYPWGDDESQHDASDQCFHNADWDGKRGLGGDAGYREFLPSEDKATFLYLGKQMARAIEGVRGQVYPVEPAFSLYPTSGAGDDWAWARHRRDPSLDKTYAFTLEFGARTFAPQWQEMKQVVGDISAALTALAVTAAGRSR